MSLLLIVKSINRGQLPGKLCFWNASNQICFSDGVGVDVDAVWISSPPLWSVSASDPDTGVCWDFHDVQDFHDDVVVDGVDQDCPDHDEPGLLDCRQPPSPAPGVESPELCPGAKY